jgi:uncharacterized membrane protein YphA (DoxX/SURF4 family)
MTPETQMPPSLSDLTPAVERMRAEHWTRLTRIAFRFCFLYFSLYVLVTQMVQSLITFPKLEYSELGALPPLRPLIFWVAGHVFDVTQALVFKDSGSGDKTFDWIESLLLLVIAILAAAVWSWFDRHRENYSKLHAWLRLFLRLALAATMFAYGVDKAIPLQMPFPGLTRLLEPYGNFSPASVLWYFVGASRPYEIFAGCAEILGGVLLLVPRTTMLGALICLADLIQVFVLNMTYDIPVKLFSFHLIVLSLVLLAPDASRLVNFLLRDRATGPSAAPQLFKTGRTNRIALVLQILFGVYLLAVNFYNAAQAWKTYGGGAPRSALYGIWNVEQFSVDGQPRAPLLTDAGRPRRIVFQSPENATFQQMDDSFSYYGASIKAADKSLILSKASDKNWSASFTYQQPAPDHLLLEGTMDNHKIQVQLTLFDRNKFLLVSRGFHWIQEYPFYR